MFMKLQARPMKYSSPWQVQLAFCVFLAEVRPSNGCSVFAAGRLATKDGSVLVSHSDDGSLMDDARLIYVPAMDHEDGSKRPIFYTTEDFPRYVGDAQGPDYKAKANMATTGYNNTMPIGYIDQVPHTFGYQSGDYGMINEHGVAIGESTCGAVFGTCGRGSSIACEPGREVGEALMSIDTLSYIAAERCRTAREAVELMGRLSLEYGFYGPPDSFEGSGESLMVADADEVWAFQILSDPTGTSAIWAAKRLPDTDVSVVANMFTIRVVDPEDKENFIWSPNLFAVARDQGWWNEGDPFDFTLMYSGGEYAHKYYSGRRMWRAFQLAAPSLELPDEYDDIRYNPVYPWSVKPDTLVTHHDFMAWHRDWYAGTRYDMTKGVQAGPFGTPDRFDTVSNAVKGNWERSIAIYRSDAVYVHHLQHPRADLPQSISKVMWYGAGAAHYTPFLPVPSGVSQSLRPLRSFDPRRPVAESMSWATRRVMDVCQIRWDRMHPLVESAQKAVEADGEALLARLRTTNGRSLDVAIEAHAEHALTLWRELSMKLLDNFNFNADLETMKQLSYPDDWLKGAGYKDGPSGAPVEDQCPPLCDSSPVLPSSPLIIGVFVVAALSLFLGIAWFGLQKRRLVPKRDTLGRLKEKFLAQGSPWPSPAMTTPSTIAPWSPPGNTSSFTDSPPPRWPSTGPDADTRV